MRSLLIATLVACSSAAPKPDPGRPPPIEPVQPPIARPTEPPKPPGLRLDGRVRPTRYAVELTIVPTQEAFTGTAVLALQVAEPTTVIWVHAVDLTIQTATIKTGGTVQAARAVAPSPVSDETKEYLAFVVDQPIGPGAAELTVNYTGKIYTNEYDGVYRQTERGEWYVYTQFEETSARRAFPCFDEPSYKVPFELTLHVKREHVAVANAPIASETDDAGGMKTVRFAPTKPLPTYLIALGVGPFEIVNGGKGGKNGVPLRIIVPKGRSGEVGYATKATPELLALIEDYFGMPYPYEKLDQIVVLRKPGAMENAGLITYGLPIIAFPPAEETIARKRVFATVAAHELAHHWFGDLVTLAWWDDIWLNESFASWMEDEIAERWQPDWGIGVSKVQRRSAAMGGDNSAETRKIRQPITSRHDIAAAFDGITYAKGSSVIAMLEQWIGRDKFQRALRRYVAKHAHGTATTADFMAALSAEAGTDVAPVFTSFLDQPGAPLVTAELACAKGAPPKLLLTQRRYTVIGSTVAADQTWKVPVCVETEVVGATKAEARVCTVLAEPRGELVLPTPTCPAWVQANAGQLGYYRVQYQGALLDKLLAVKSLTVAERVGLLGDQLALVESGHVPVGKLLERVPALAREQNRHLTEVTGGYLNLLSNDLVPEALRPNRARFVRKMIGARARALGWKPGANEPDDTRLVRPALLSLAATTGEDPALIAGAKKLADKWLADHTAVAPDLVGLVLTVAARNGDRALFDRFRTAAKAEREIRERRMLIGALSSFRDPALVKASLALALGDELEARDSISLVYGAFYQEQTRELAWEFLKANLEKLLARLARDSGGGFVRLGGMFCDAAHRDDAAAFFKERAKTYLEGPRTYARMIERIDLCIARKAAHQPSVVRFLKKH
ncbi:MAG TPA: M1 family metallopeptidase [Kofleriaceae bacterium]